MKILINFYANITEQSVKDMMIFVTQQLASPNASSFDELIIQISSPGGSSDHGLLAYNFLKQVNIQKTTIAMGNVDSAAVMIFAAGDKRVAVESCRFLLHQALGTFSGQFSWIKMAELSKLLKKITHDYCAVIAKVCAKPLVGIKGKVNKGVVLSSEEAKHLGLVTEISNEPYLASMNNLAIMMISNPTLQLPQNSQPPQNSL